MFTSLKRIVKFGWQGFARNKGLSFSAVFVMSIAIFLLTSLFLFQGLSSFLIKEAQKKVDISVYFKKETKEEDILEIKNEIWQFSNQIEDIQYISQTQALQIFLQKHQEDPLYLIALQELGQNPFLASLNIKAKEATDYSKISNLLKEAPFNNLIQKISYFENKKVIDKLFSITSNIKTLGIILSLILGFFAALFIFNNIKLTLFNLRDEVSTMKLVGAGNWFIRGPFLVQGLICGTFAVLFTNLIFIFALIFFNSNLEKFLLNFNLLNYFKESFLLLLLLQVIFAFGLVIFSTFLVLRKYLKI
ncbi:MAG: permease-like cell division protein FtsX [Patescibacteria group bacterium]|nr:permease-like cell division protein FtsX [Patescibacteria group bacterium]